MIGAGPSGVSSAINCAKKGLKVLIVDLNSNSGGQIYRAPPKTYKASQKNLKKAKFKKSFLMRSKNSKLKQHLIIQSGKFLQGLR